MIGNRMETTTHDIITMWMGSVQDEHLALSCGLEDTVACGRLPAYLYRGPTIAHV